MNTSLTAPLLAGFLSGLALIIAIGSQNAFVLRQALRREHRLPITVICILADTLLIFAGIAGLGALIGRHPTLLMLTRYGGAAFLLFYAALAARRAWQGEQLTVAGDAGMTRLGAILACLAFTFLNPHVYLDTVILLGTLANQHERTIAGGRWIFGIGAATASLVWFTALTYGASYLEPLFRKQVAWRILDSAIALIMSALAIQLLYAV